MLLVLELFDYKYYNRNVIIYRSTFGESLVGADVDECASGNFDCEKDSVCRNLPGSYYCTCSLGYKFDGRTSCERDADFEFDEVILKQVEAGETELVRRKSITGIYIVRVPLLKCFYSVVWPYYI
jgi:Calcium-binding EGF domain